MKQHMLWHHVSGSHRALIMRSTHHRNAAEYNPRPAVLDHCPHSSTPEAGLSDDLGQGNTDKLTLAARSLHVTVRSLTEPDGKELARSLQAKGGFTPCHYNLNMLCCYWVAWPTALLTELTGPG